uniref:Uncharacterized protein n=1 Tax=Myoviridae sp. ctplG2 TaxID=2826700 RepID=A0A8S5LW98_9CAUD|nr:MAG TPA: hypothetical protein [Myoviridae sp. ctplG2]
MGKNKNPLCANIGERKVMRYMNTHSQLKYII